jgi:Legume lectin domain/Protein of unknown function (DUF1573)
MSSKCKGLSLLAVLLGLVALVSAPLSAQINFSDFSNVSSLALNGTAAPATNTSGQKVLRLNTDDQFHVSGTAWFATQQQSVTGGFSTTFEFQISRDADNEPGPADGIAFVIQNSSGTGFGTTARGGSGGAIGYGVPDPGDNGTAIPNGLAIELDTYQNPWDPDANHIAVQSCGTDPLTQNHEATCPTSGLSAELGLVSNPGGITLADGAVHTLVVDYDPGANNTPGVLRVFLDNVGTPVLTVNVNLSTLLSLNDGNAWVGFTGSTGGSTEINDILNWTFTPATAQTSITETITPNDPNPTDNNYVFGSYNHKVEYSNAQGADTVTVTAIPISQTNFLNTRLVGSNFFQNHPNTQCAIYEGTGGLCVLFEVTCTNAPGSTDCSTLNYDLFNNFNTQQTINGACLLKTPIGSNNWANIIETFTQTRNDPGTKSKSNGFSDFVVGQNCTAPPSFSIATPANGGVYPPGPLTLSFVCNPDPDAPNVTVNSCTGLWNGNPVNSGDTITLTTIGPASFPVSATDSVGNSSSQTSYFTVGQAPAFTSGNAVTFQTGVFGSFTVTTTGTPSASIMASGALPGGVSFTNNGNGTATLAGTPNPATGGVYNLVFTATNSIGNATQAFTLTVNQPPVITSANNVNFPLGVFSSFTITSTGFPAAAISESGALPNGVGFANNGNGTGTLSGTPTVTGTFNLTLSASNVAGTATQAFTLTTSGPQVSINPTSLNFGTVNWLSLLWKNVTIQNTGTSTLQLTKVSVTPGQGADGDDFTPLNLCKSTLAPGKSCTVTVFYFADDIGTANATLNIYDNAPGSPQTVSLTGTAKKGH